MVMAIPSAGYASNETVGMLPMQYWGPLAYQVRAHAESIARLHRLNPQQPPEPGRSWRSPQVMDHYEELMHNQPGVAPRGTEQPSVGSTKKARVAPPGEQPSVAPSSQKPGVAPLLPPVPIQPPAVAEPGAWSYTLAAYLLGGRVDLQYTPSEVAPPPPIQDMFREALQWRSVDILQLVVDAAHHAEELAYLVEGPEPPPTDSSASSSGPTARGPEPAHGTTAAEVPTLRGVPESLDSRFLSELDRIPLLHESEYVENGDDLASDEHISIKVSVENTGMYKINVNPMATVSQTVAKVLAFCRIKDSTWMWQLFADPEPGAKLPRSLAFNFTLNQAGVGSGARCFLGHRDITAGTGTQVEAEPGEPAEPAEPAEPPSSVSVSVLRARPGAEISASAAASVGAGVVA